MGLNTADLWVGEGRLPIEHFLFQEIEESRQKKEAWASSWTPSEILSESQNAKTLIAGCGSSGKAKDLPTKITQNSIYIKDACGFIFLRPPGALWEITLIYVRPEDRGKGVSGALLTKAKHIALSGEFPDKRIGLEVRRDNLVAIQAYQKAGFLDVGVRKRYYRDGCDALLLEMSAQTS